jgi:hypothetical protein
MADQPDARRREPCSAEHTPPAVCLRKLVAGADYRFAGSERNGEPQNYCGKQHRPLTFVVRGSAKTSQSWNDIGLLLAQCCRVGGAWRAQKTARAGHERVAAERVTSPFR